MKKILSFLFKLAIFLIVGAICFYFWAKSGNLSQSEYSRLQHHKDVVVNAENDSLLSVLSYNIGYFSGMTNNEAVRPSRDFYKKNEELVLSLLQKINPTIVGFQEIDYDSKRSYHLNQHDYIANAIYPYSLVGVNWDKNYVPFPYFPLSVQFGQMLSGQSIMSKYPMEQPERIVLEKVASQPFYYTAFYLDRLLQIVRVNHPVRPFAFMNIHAEAFDKKTRENHIRYAYERFKELSVKMPVILVGDLNSDPGYNAPACAVFFADSTIGNVALDVNNPTLAEKTYPADAPKERLDYIFFTKKDFKVQEERILTEFGTISDHLPIYTVLKFRVEQE